jgi:hypothetical protein
MSSVVRVMELCSINIGLGKQKKVGRQNKVVARKVAKAFGLSLCTVRCVFKVPVRMQDNQAAL